MISNTCKYGIRAVIYLAVNISGDEKIGIKKISEDLDLPGPFLGKIMQSLAKNKMLKSVKGPHGGFSLAKDPDDISLYDIVSIIDGTDVFHECLIGVKICENNPENEKFCPFMKRSHIVRESMKKVFEEQTIGEFVRGIKSVDTFLQI
ncbi:MAG: Rrf2 family transcriptional regulator [Bacteroidales bacterium]|nr:Rrf2 family transcriptional regulator [Bacteroidales bacterium]